MSVKVLNAVFRLRRDNDYNYSPTFVPMNGEVCLVDMAAGGLKIKIGDGITEFQSLAYYDDNFISNDSPLIDTVKQGYYLNGNFYSSNQQDSEYLIAPSVGNIYINKQNGDIYYYDGDEHKYVRSSGEVQVQPASATTAGIMKLYSTVGNNTDGAMTQAATTAELNKKFSAEVSAETETLILFHT